MRIRGVELLAVIALAVVVSAGSGCAEQKVSEPAASETVATSTVSGDTLTIAIAGMVTPKSGLDYYLGLSEYVGRKVGREVRLIHKADYSEVNEMLGEGTVDVAFVCSGPYTKGHDEFGVELIAAPVVNGKPEYYSYIIAPESSDATSLAAMRGSVFAFADPESNTGCLVPTFMLADMGETPESFFKRTYFTYGHDNSIKAVATGEADGAAVDSLIWDYQNATDSQYTAKTRIVQRSEAFAIPPVVARSGLDPGLVDEVRRTFLSAHEDPEGKALLDNMKVERFVTIEDSAYDSIRRMSERIEESE